MPARMPRYRTSEWEIREIGFLSKHMGQRGIRSISLNTLRVSLFYWNFSEQTRGRLGRGTDPMKVCAITGWSRGERCRFWKICGGFGRMLAVQRECVWCVVAVFRLRSTPRSARPPGVHQRCLTFAGAGCPLVSKITVFEAALERKLTCRRCALMISS